MPTDTVYGLAVNPFDEIAVGTLFALKGRPAGKPIGLLVASAGQASELVDLPDWARALAEEHWPGPLTLVAHPFVVFPDWVGSEVDRSVAVRVPDHDLAASFLSLAGPLAVTSANKSGQPECLSDAGARRVFGTTISGYLPGTCPGGTASTIVDATGDAPVILREGPLVL